MSVGGSALISLALAGFVLRELGAERYGVFALLLQYGGVAGAVDLGLGMAVARAAARLDAGIGSPGDHEVVAAAHALYVAVGIASTVLVIGAMVATPSLLDIPDTARPAAFLAGALVAAATALATVASTPLWLLTGQRRFRLLAVVSLLGAAANLLVVVLTARRLGIVSLGLGQVATVAVNRVPVVVAATRSSPWFALRPERARRQHLRVVGGFALPLVLMSVSSQLITLNDLMVVGAASSAAAVGLYRAGSLVPTQVIGLVYRGYDSALPLLARHERPLEKAATTRIISRVAAYSSGVIFGALAASRSEVIAVVAGRPSRMAEMVLMIFCGVWVLHVPSRGMWLSCVAAGRQSRLVPALVVELVANVGLSIVLGIVWGPIGVAVATLVAVGIAYGLVVPLRYRGEMHGSSRVLAMRDGFAPAIIGAGAAFAGVAATSVVIHGTVPTLTTACMVVVVALVVGYATLSEPSRWVVRGSFEARID